KETPNLEATKETIVCCSCALCVISGENPPNLHKLIIPSKYELPASLGGVMIRSFLKDEKLKGSTLSAKGWSLCKQTINSSCRIESVLIERSLRGETRIPISSSPFFKARTC